MTLDFTNAAIADLRSIRSYTLRTWGEKQEQIYIDSLWNKFEELLADPQRWKKRNDLFFGCQIATHSKHVILFRIDHDTFHIVRVLHSAMDFQKQLEI